MKAERTISLRELQELQKAQAVISLHPKSNQVVVDGFKRFNATDYTLEQFRKGDVCYMQQSQS